MPYTMKRRHYPFHFIRELYVVVVHMNVTFILPQRQIPAISVMTTHFIVTMYLATDSPLILTYYLNYN